MIMGHESDEVGGANLRNRNTFSGAFKSQTAGGLPIDQNNGLVFGFLDEELVEALNENN